VAGWNLIADVVAGERPLICDDLWDEVRAALAERWSAVVAVWGGDDGTPVDVAPRDRIGFIEAYRYAYRFLVRSYSIGDNPWAKEVVAGNANSVTGCPTWMIDDGPAEWAVNIFAAAGLPNDWWTHSSGQYNEAPSPALPRAAMWTDFHALAGVETLLRLYPLVYAGSGSSGGYESSDEQDAVWVVARADGWTNLAPVGGEPFLIGLGRMARGDNIGGPEPFNAQCEFVGNRDLALDLSSRWDVDHLGGGACDPTRVLFYVLHRPHVWCGPLVGGWWVDATAAADYVVKLSGDGGATWETIGSFTSDPNEAWTITKCVSSDSARWTATSVIRVEYVDDRNADTPEWLEPNGGTTWYSDGISPEIFAFAEFDWDFT